MLNSLDSSLIIGYIVLVLIIGYISSRKQTGADFMIANRKLGLFGFVSTMVASLIGGTILVVYTAFIYEFGVGALFGFVGLTLGFIVFIALSKQLRTLGHKYNFHTIADYFSHKIGSTQGNLISVVIGLILVLAILKQFIAGTGILSAISGWSYELALGTSALVVLIYLLLGGFKSVVKTDVFQFAILFILVVAIAINITNSSDLSFSHFSLSSMSPTLMVSFLIYGFLGIWHLSDIWQRIYAAKNDKVVKQGLLISGIIMFIIGLAIALIALSVRASTPGLDPSQAIVFGMINLLPQGLLAFGIVMLFAAIMSTTDTAIFVLSTIIAKDGITKIKKRVLTSDELTRYTRISIVAIIVLGATLAYLFRDIIDVALVNVGLSMALVPSIITSLKWKPEPRVITLSITSGLLYIALLAILGLVTPELSVSTVLVSGTVLGIGQVVSKKLKK